MKVAGLDILRCDAGWRNYHFLKLTTDGDIVGWSEFDEDFGFPGVSAVIERLAARVIGQNPYDHERIYTELYCFTRPAAGGAVAEELGAIENALLNAKALGVPCYALLGGKVCDRRAGGPNPTRKRSVRTRQKCSGACCTTGGPKPLPTPAVIFPPGC